MNINVGLIGPSSPNFKGGIVHFSNSLYQALINSKIPTTFYSFSRSYPKPFYQGKIETNEKNLRPNEEVAIIDWLNPLSWINTVKTIKRNSHSHIVFQWWTWFWSLPYLIIIKYLKKNKNFNPKIVFIIHNIYDHETNVFKKMISKQVIKNAELLIVHSQQEFIKINKIFKNKKIKKIYHPEYDRFKFKNKITKKMAQKKLKIESPSILFFGHIRPYKGLCLLLQALTYLDKKINLIIAGEIWGNKNLYKKIIKKYNLENRIHIYNNYIPDKEVPLYFHATDIVVLPYKKATGTGVSKIASFFKKNIVATPVGDLIDMSEYYKNIYLCKSKLPIDIANKISEVFNKTAENNNFKKEKINNWSKYIDKMLV